MDTIKTFVFLLIFTLLIPGVAAAQSYQAPTGIPSTVISVNKTVQRPGASNFVENLGVNDPKYQPGNTVQFQIVVTNTGNTTLNNIQITDNFPSYLVNASDNKNSTSTTINSLRPNQSQVITVTGKVAERANLPQDQRVFCLVNQAVARMNNQVSTDNAQLCVENSAVSEQVTTKGGLPVYQPSQVTTVPKTGPEVLALFGLLPGGALGYWLRKKSVL